jgi:hypothetical protein
MASGHLSRMHKLHTTQLRLAGPGVAIKTKRGKELDTNIATVLYLRGATVHTYKYLYIVQIILPILHVCFL